MKKNKKESKMFCIKDMYGSDADGNRGQSIVEYEIEPEDEIYIIEQIKDKLVEQQFSYESEIEIYLYCKIIGEDIEIRVYIDDYLSKDEYDEIIEECT